jgi:hypothetical protein
MDYIGSPIKTAKPAVFYYGENVNFYYLIGRHMGIDFVAQGNF